MLIKTHLKNIVAFLLYRSGVLDLFLRNKSYNQGFVLMYHRVISTEQARKSGVQHSMYVTPETFELHIRVLKRNFNIIPLSELILRAKAGKNNGGYCSITFDDGWLDNYTNVYPVVVDYRVPVAIFLATGFIGTDRWFWPDVVTYCLSSIIVQKREQMLPEAIMKYVSKMLDDKSVSYIAERVIVYLKSFSVKQRKALVDDIHKASGVTFSQRLVMNWGEIQEMDNCGYVEFGAHTVNHEMLDQLEGNDIIKEISLSKEKIEYMLGKTCSLFCYPNGNVNNKAKEIIKKLNFQGAVTTKRGYVDPFSDYLEIPRFGVHEDISHNEALLMWRIVF